jgi:chemotaxis protein MotB
MTTYDHNALQSLRPPSRAPWVLLVATIAGAAGGGYWLYGERERARTAEKVALTSEKSAKEAEEESRKSLTEQVEKLEGEKTELAAAKAEMAKDIEAKTGELAQLKGTYDKLQDKMKDEIADGNIRLSQSGGRLRVDLVDKILFDSGEAQISKRGEGVLARVGAVLAAMDDKQIQVSGHTDKTPISEKLAPQFPTNWELSVARATNVVRFLQEKASVPPERMVASGYGEFHPIAPNKNAAGRARNRRIEILLTPSLDPKAISKTKLKEARAEATKGPDKGGAEKTAEKTPEKVAEKGPAPSRHGKKRK